MRIAKNGRSTLPDGRWVLYTFGMPEKYERGHTYLVSSFKYSRHNPERVVYWLAVDNILVRTPTDDGEGGAVREFPTRSAARAYADKLVALDTKPAAIAAQVPAAARRRSL
jgi:hypothetical protein